MNEQGREGPSNGKGRNSNSELTKKKKDLEKTKVTKSDLKRRDCYRAAGTMGRLRGFQDSRAKKIAGQKF